MADCPPTPDTEPLAFDLTDCTGHTPPSSNAASVPPEFKLVQIVRQVLRLTEWNVPMTPRLIRQNTDSIVLPVECRSAASRTLPRCELRRCSARLRTSRPMPRVCRAFRQSSGAALQICILGNALRANFSAVSRSIIRKRTSPFRCTIR